MPICKLLDSRSFIIGKNDFVISPLVEATHSLCHSISSASFNSLTTALFGILLQAISATLHSVHVMFLITEDRMEVHLVLR